MNRVEAFERRESNPSHCSARRRAATLTNSIPQLVCCTLYLLVVQPMATPFLVGIGAIAAGLAGRHILRRRAMGAADQWVKGGFKSKMDRRLRQSLVSSIHYIYLFSSSLSRPS